MKLKSMGRFKWMDNIVISNARFYTIFRINMCRSFCSHPGNFREMEILVPKYLVEK